LVVQILQGYILLIFSPLCKDKLSDDRRTKLDDLGFSWSVGRTWDENFHLLAEYKEKDGDCNVPQKYKQDPTLGRWVDKLRQTKDNLSDEQCAKLDDLGFAWINEQFDNRWEEMFTCLQRYAGENGGDCNMSKNDANYELCLWISKQRQRKPLLSKERRSKLDDLGLTWEDADKEKADRKWNEMYQRLIVYKRRRGDCLVPRDWEEGEKPYLDMWVRNQR
jgi:uncharacterized protein YjiS (DUF1127 family)